MKITETVHQVEGVTGAPAIIVGLDYLSLVDTGTPGAEAQIFALVESLGRKRQDIKHILMTHSDGDHAGALAEVAAATGARVYAGQHEADVIGGKRPLRSGKMIATPAQVDVIVKDDDVLPLHGGIRVVETFGHTPGHIAFYLLSEKLLFTGDCLTNTQGLTGSLPQFTADPAQATATVHKLAALNPESLAFGHGPAIIGGADTHLRALAKATPRAPA
jgi:glyoxylase-like metal-dependent hydrolase (beta-lactamase superfamily II)